MFRLSKILTIGLSLIIGMVFTSSAIAEIGQGFSTKETDLIQGMAVGLSLESTDQQQFIEALTTSNKHRFLGVITSREANVVTATESDDNVIVSTGGQAEVLASDLNGSINKGDSLSASPIKGIVMRAEPNESVLVGYALEDFNNTTLTSQSVTDTQGNKQNVKIGSISVKLGSKKSTEDKPQSFLTLVGESITGKPVSQLQVAAALLLMFVLLTVEGSIIYGATHSSIQAVGRNPLAKKSVYKHLVQILITAVLILVFGLVGIYLILWA